MSFGEGEASTSVFASVFMLTPVSDSAGVQGPA
jgi:hypothetical protein